MKNFISWPNRSSIQIVSLAIIVIAIHFLSACKKEDKKDTIIPNQEELITTVIWTLTPDSGVTNYTFSFRDLDGDGGNPPIIEADTLSPNTIFAATISLQDESVNPAEDITAEVMAEDEAHQLFYQLPGTSVTSISYNDMDANGNPIGLSTIVQTNGPEQSTVRITLRHEPLKFASGVSGGDISNAGGETDIEVDFDFVVQ